MDFCTIASQLNVASAKCTPINCRDGCADPLSGSIILRIYSAQSQLSIVDGEIDAYREKYFGRVRLHLLVSLGERILPLGVWIS